MTVPRHLAIIMDGNGRWAKSRRHHRIFGHLRGARVAKTIIEECARLGVPHLTLFAFSTENWFRPEAEVRFLMNLLVRQLGRERGTLRRENIRFRAIGDLARLPRPVREAVRTTIEDSARHTGMTLTFALSYGGRQELTDVAREVARRVAAGEMTPDEVDEATVATLLPSSILPDPDLIIRTSGERRLSNFFLWQAAYSEIEFEAKAWPDFTAHDLRRIIADFAGRERRFGRTSEQLHAGPR